ncbi:MAG: AAA family ATPase [Methanoregula sp.]|nr:MAG: AAA family ATPase [Methanoregula sp.]
MKVIGVVGLPASGKGEFARIATQQGVPVIVMGDVIRAAVHKAGLTPDDRNMGAMANKLRKVDGMDAIAKLCIPAIQQQSSSIVLVDGIRGDAEVRLFRRHFPGFVMVAIDSPFDIRLARLASRGRSDDTTSEESLRLRDERELGWGLGAALSKAEYRLQNDGDLATFEQSVRNLLQMIGDDP